MVFAQESWLIWDEFSGLDPQPSFIDDGGELCLVSLYEANNADPKHYGACNVGGNFIDFYMADGEIWAFERTYDFGWIDSPVAEPTTSEKFRFQTTTGNEYFLWKASEDRQIDNEDPSVDMDGEWYTATGDPVISLGVDFENFNIPVNITRYFDEEQNKGTQYIEISR